MYNNKPSMPVKEWLQRQNVNIRDQYSLANIYSLNYFGECIAICKKQDMVHETADSIL